MNIVRLTSAVLGSLVAAASVVGAASTSASAAPDPYSPSVTTECRVSVPPVVEPGERVTIRVVVAANSAAPPRGDVRVSVGRDPGGTEWARTVSYAGGTLRVAGPRLGPGDYVVTSRFMPDDASFSRCRGVLGYRVAADDTDIPDDDGDDDETGGGAPGGFLPDTGGPDLLWLLVGVGMVGTGAVVVARSRRRETTALA